MANKMNHSELLDSLDDFTLGYIEAMLWTGRHYFDEHCEGDHNLEDYYASDISEDGLRSIVADCKDFQASNVELLTLAGNDAQNGHDFLLTRNGHGCGFWDRGYGTVGDALSDASKTYGTQEADLFGDSETIEISG